MNNVSELRSAVEALERAPASSASDATRKVAGIGPPAVPILLERIRAIKMCERHIQALIQIGFPDNQQAIDTLVHKLGGFESGYPMPALLAARALAEIGTPCLESIITALQSQALDDSLAAGVGNVILNMRMTIADRITLLPLIEWLLDSAKARDHYSYVDLIAFLGTIGSPSANRIVPTLGYYVSYGNDEDVRLAAVNSLSRFDPSALKDAKSAILKAAADSDPAVARAANDLASRLL